MTVVLAPLPGRVVALADVPDPVFAQQMVGSGVAIEPARGQGPLTVVAPISGKIDRRLPGHYAIRVVEQNANEGDRTGALTARPASDSVSTWPNNSASSISQL